MIAKRRESHIQRANNQFAAHRAMAIIRLASELSDQLTDDRAISASEVLHLLRSCWPVECRDRLAVFRKSELGAG